MTTRRPNSGPYVVSYGYNGVTTSQHECHTWKDACNLMRHLLINGYTEIKVHYV